MKLKDRKNRLLAPALVFAMAISACTGKAPEELMATARSYMASNDNAAAIIELKNALQENPELLEARVLLGQAMLANGDPVGAEVELRKAREGNYQPDVVSPLLAQAWVQTGQFDKVTGAFDQVRLGSPSAQANMLTWVSIAWRQQDRRDFYRKRLDEALVADPEHVPALIERARRKASDRDFADALIDLDGVLKLDPRSAEALKLRGDVLQFGMRKKEDALAEYRAAVALSPKYLDGHAALVRTLLSAGAMEEAQKALDVLSSIAPGRPITLYLQAQLAYQKKDMKLAKERIQQLLKLTPDSPSTNELAGVLELQGGSAVQALSHLSKALRASPDLQVARQALVMANLRAGQVDQAIAALPAGFSPEATDADPVLLSLAGRAHMAKGDFAKAQAFFKRAMESDPSDPAKRTSLAVSQLMTGQSSLALSELNAIAEQDPGTVADMALINTYLGRRDFAKALAAIGKLKTKLETDPMPRHLEGVVQLALNDKIAARKAFEDSLSLDDKYLASVAALAVMDIADKKPELALKRLEALTTKAPDNAQAWMALADVHQTMGSPSVEIVKSLERAIQAAPGESRPRVMLVEHLLRQQDHKTALSTAQAALAVLPESPDVLAAVGRAQASAGETLQALSTFNRLASLIPNSPLPYMLMASTQLENKDAQAAMRSLEKALEINPEFLPAQKSLVEVAAAGRLQEKALNVSRSVQKQRPKLPIGFVMEGDVRAVFKDWDGAAAAYRAALKVASASDVAVKLYSVLIEGGKRADADKWASEWTKQFPKDIALERYLGDKAISANELAVAEKHYQRVLAVQPNDAQTLNNLAWIGGKSGRGDAIAMAEKAVALAPDQPAFMDTLAMLYSSAGSHQKALELQKKVVELRPDIPVFKLNLAQMLIKSGDKSAARTVLEQLRGMGDKFSGQGEVQRLLKDTQ